MENEAKAPYRDLTEEEMRDAFHEYLVQQHTTSEDNLRREQYAQRNLEPLVRAQVSHPEIVARLPKVVADYLTCCLKIGEIKRERRGLRSVYLCRPHDLDLSDPATASLFEKFLGEEDLFLRSTPHLRPSE